MTTILGKLKRWRASQANEKGLACDAEGKLPEAIENYELSCRLDPSFSSPFYNLGLIYKYVGDWERSLELNRRAAALDPGFEASWWNLGIAATALGRWQIAREAWRACGAEVPPGEGPPDLPCGRRPIRLNPNGAAEVVWADRIDPARALLKNVPLPEAGFRFHDIVLNDGAAVGYRMLDGREVPVYNCLQLLAPSPFSTFVAEIELAAGLDPEEAVEKLVALAEESGQAAENWSTSLHMLCAACSEGRPHEHHDGRPLDLDEGPLARTGRQRIGLAARSLEEARSLLETWRAHRLGIELISLEKALSAEVM
jgi:tetratricopeptide (TPR) repeat protein